MFFQVVEASFNGDAEEPGLKFALGIEAVEVGEGLDEGFLCDIEGIVVVSQDIDGEGDHWGLVFFHQWFEVTSVALQTCLNQLVFVVSIHFSF